MFQFDLEKYIKKNDEKIKFLSAPKMPKPKKKELNQIFIIEEPVIDKNQIKIERLQKIKDVSKNFNKEMIKKKKQLDEDLNYQ